MNKKQQIPNPARTFLDGYLDAKYFRRRLLAVGPEAQTVHAEEIARQEERMRRVVDMIASLRDKQQRDVLTMRYINGWPWRRIIFEMGTKGYSESAAYSLHGRALQHVNEMLAVCDEMRSKLQ